MKNMKISKKLFTSFAIVIALSLVIGGAGIVGLMSLSNAAGVMYDSNIMAIEAMGSLRELFALERNDLRAIFLSKDNPDTVNQLISGFTTYAATADECFAQYEKTILDESVEGAYYTAKEAYLGDYAKMKADIFAHINSGDFDTAYATFTGGTAVIAPINNGLSESATMNNTWALEENNKTTNLSIMLTILMVGLLVIAVITSAVLGSYISSVISKPISVLTSFMVNAGSTGDITLRKEDIESIAKFAECKDETGQCIGSTAKFIQHISTMAEKIGAVEKGDLTIDVNVLSDRDVMGIALKNMVNNLNVMFGSINTAAEQVNSGASQVSSASQSLAQGATEQASSIEELSASIQEISSQVNVNSKNADDATDIANETNEEVKVGNSQMQQMLEAMDDINSSSNEISKIIKVIDDIAFQTNILALNAAVEAARAGEAGKGFAVVADEVRNLASKSADAAKQTTGLIEGSIQSVSRGADIANKTAHSLELVEQKTVEVNRIIAEIAAASKEQAQGITQINIGVEQISSVIQTNSATAEESAAAAEELSSQSSLLQEQVAKFKLNHNAGW